MTRATGPPDCYVGFQAAIVCPRCGKGAVLVKYDDETGVAQYLHVTRNRKKWHSVKLGTRKELT